MVITRYDEGTKGKNSFALHRHRAMKIILDKLKQTIIPRERETK